MARTEMRRQVAHVIPDRLRTLPVDERGYPVPFFVAWIDGKPDHRITDPAKFRVCILKHRCWICGRSLGKFATFTVGPMCIVNMASGEPPAHQECARFAVQACPFLTLPRAVRRDAHLPAEHTVHPDMLQHNPGAMILWTTDTWDLMPGSQWGNAAPLVQFGEPSRVSFWCQGRTATRGELLDAMARGLPQLQHLADLEGGNAPTRLAQRVDAAMFWFPDA